MSELRDLEADRRLIEQLREETFNLRTYEYKLWIIADAALDEIDRLKGLLVWGVADEWAARTTRRDIRYFRSQAAAWAAVRKAAAK